ncbi:Transcriptional regulator of ribosomal biogenesis protein [Podila humilis]|nr:Transcriptional regulator of ribosomal biogenesis protein [Podila humilis]
MPTTAASPSPNINITSSTTSAGTSSSGHTSNGHLLGTPASFSSMANSPFSASTLATAAALRRPSLVLSVGSFHAAQLRRPSFFAPFPYSQSPQQSDSVVPDYSSSPRRGDVYQRDLEANYCTNFSCCGQILGDLHALLQHYEEAHVRFEEDDDNGHPVPAGFTDDDGWSTGSEDISTSPQSRHHRHELNPFQNRSTHPNNVPIAGGSNLSSMASASAAATVAALTAQQQQHQKLSPLSYLNARKKSTSVSLSDIYSVDSGFTPDDAISAFPNSILRTAAQAKEASLANKKRDLATFSTSYDTHSPLAKKASSNLSTPPQQSKAGQAAAAILIGMSTAKNSLSHDGNVGGAMPSTKTTQQQDELLSTMTGYLEYAIQQGMLSNCGEVGSPTFLLAAEDLIKKREEIVRMMQSIGQASPSTSSADKPYRCTVAGCDKAYKNPNGLKYHNQHGHTTQPGESEDDRLQSRPYRCTFLDCGKNYKNLNGLKYHIEHSHPNLAAALHAHIPEFASLDGTNLSQAAIAAAAAIAAVQANPMMMAAANAIMSSSTTTTTQLNSNSASPLMTTTPSSAATTTMIGSSPPMNTILARSFTAYRGNDHTDVTPMTSPVLSRAALPEQTATGTSARGSVSEHLTPSALSPTQRASSGAAAATLGLTAPLSAISQVSTLTTALAAVSVEPKQNQQQQ